MAAATSLANSAALGAGIATPRAPAPGVAPVGSSLTLQIAPGAIVVQAAPGQSPTQIADATVTTLAERVRAMLPTN